MSPIWRRMLPAAVLLLGGRAAFAAPASMTCTPASFAQLSPNPARIVVPAAAVTGSDLWSGTLSLDFSCTASASGATLAGGIAVGGSTPTAMVGSGGAADGVSIVSTAAPSLSLSAPGCSLGASSQKNNRWTFSLSSTAAGTCSGTLVVPLQLLRDTSALGTDVAASNPIGGTTDWVVFPVAKGGGGTSSVGLSAAVPLVSGGGCTVSPVALSVSLPAVSVVALAAAGQSAGDTAFRFPLQSCTAAAATPYSVYASWTYAAVAGYPTVIANSAAGAAGNVGVQILDASGNPVASGPSSPSQVANVDASGGVAAQTYIARYVATGAVTPGAVTATATYTLTYQ